MNQKLLKLIRNESFKKTEQQKSEYMMDLQSSHEISSNESESNEGKRPMNKMLKGSDSRVFNIQSERNLESKNNENEGMEGNEGEKENCTQKVRLLQSNSRIRKRSRVSAEIEGNLTPKEILRKENQRLNAFKHRLKTKEDKVKLVEELNSVTNMQSKLRVCLNNLNNQLTKTENAIVSCPSNESVKVGQGIQVEEIHETGNENRILVMHEN